MHPLVNKRRVRSPAPWKCFRSRPSRFARVGNRGVNLAGAIALLLSAVGMNLARPPVGYAARLPAAPWPVSSSHTRANPQALWPSSHRHVGSPVAQAPAAPSPETVAAPAAETEPEAPSVIWLIVMPAVPLVGGTGIYLSRRLFGGKGGECRLIAEVTPPAQTPTEEPVPREDEPLE